MIQNPSIIIVQIKFLNKKIKTKINLLFKKISLNLIFKGLWYKLSYYELKDVSFESESSIRQSIELAKEKMREFTDYLDLDSKESIYCHLLESKFYFQKIGALSELC